MALSHNESVRQRAAAATAATAASVIKARVGSPLEDGGAAHDVGASAPSSAAQPLGPHVGLIAWLDLGPGRRWVEDSRENDWAKTEIPQTHELSKYGIMVSCPVVSVQGGAQHGRLKALAAGRVVMTAFGVVRMLLAGATQKVQRRHQTRAAV